MTHCALEWLCQPVEFRARLKAARVKGGAFARQTAIDLARFDLDFVQTNAVDHLFQSALDEGGGVTKPLRLAIVGSSTLAHLHASIRVASLRHGVEVTTYEPDYGQYRQELLNPSSGLHAFMPDVVLFAFDAQHLATTSAVKDSGSDIDGAVNRCLQDLGSLWKLARERLNAVVLQQTALPVFPDLLGNNEQRLPGSKVGFVTRLNAALPGLADAADVHLVAIDRHASRIGLRSWHDPALWHRAKQEISLHAAPYYGDLVARLLGAIRGRSSKALVLDLDNTLWGGVIGDDGLEGIALGQGSATGEAFAAVQSYAYDLGKRGIILAVCSKNDESVAFRAFDEHPEMILRRSNIASFVANWDDKASNIRRIARELNLGLDALVFLDDNPFERNLVRQELPMVAVPEVPEDPALVPSCLAAAGYFEALSITADDAARQEQYQANRERQALADASTDMDSYLQGLEMRLRWGHFDGANQTRVVQLVNKTNQFNLTTQRITEPEANSIIGDPDVVGLHFRLMDRYGDNGLIGVIIGYRDGTDLRLDTWLMSCRVLGRRAEEAMLAVVVEQARKLGLTGITGRYVPSPKNHMVREHYNRLGFSCEKESPDGTVFYCLELNSVQDSGVPIHIEEIS